MKKNCEHCNGTGNTRTDNVGYCRCKYCDGKGWYLEENKMDEYELAPDSVFRVKAKKLLRGLARVSVDPDYARKLCKEFEVDFDESMIYTKNRYREQSDGCRRVDGEDLIIYICKSIGMNPDKVKLEFSNKFCGEGSRRDAVEEAYLGRET